MHYKFIYFISSVLSVKDTISLAFFQTFMLPPKFLLKYMMHFISQDMKEFINPPRIIHYVLITFFFYVCAVLIPSIFL